MSVDVNESTRREHATVLVARMKLRDQTSQAIKCSGEIRCGCGMLLPVHCLYKCLYCGCWFCRICAHKHFGSQDGPVPTEEWRAERDAAAEKPEAKS